MMWHTTLNPISNQVENGRDVRTRDQNMFEEIAHSPILYPTTVTLFQQPNKEVYQ